MLSAVCLMGAVVVQLLWTGASSEDDVCALSEKYWKYYAKFNIDIEVQKVDGNTVPLKTEMDEGTVLTIKCAKEGEVFVNGVRNIQGVNITLIDEDYKGVIVTKCSSTAWYPDLFSKIQDPGIAGGSRYLFCQPGCDRLISYSHTASYPDGTLTRETNSPPVEYSDEKITLSCKDGFVRANSDILTTTVKCDISTKGWDVEMKDRMTCLRGCKDVRESVSGGSTEVKASTKEARPPFTTGDILAFSCDSGKTLQGYSTVTCNSLNLWSTDLPTCV